MAEGGGARRGARGGGGIPAARPYGPRLVLAALALLDAAALGIYPPVHAGRFESALAWPGAAAFLFVGAAVVVGWEVLAPWAAAVLGAGYGGSLFAARDGVDVLAPVYGALLLLLVELVAWSLQERVRVAVDVRALAARAGAVAAMCAAGAAVGYVVLGAGALRGSGGLAWEAVGVVAAVTAVALATLGSRR